ncbi:acyl-CoA dehydrogenase family protein [Ferruginivarius sediminum]|uniref:Acyl-CoA dehydrogenase n=1 Tax=Ferruginivarius sediminum TaxID=2661937 RepID=A0A369T7W2_9PROT|nr:acyl-CoA dehydrogenase family protein [Ferruginivarius sediminum]RDD60267.1 acyl-CoA dehydrogenase [Ferruginivarius sediminum]
MDFAPTTEQELVVDSVRKFVEQECYPHEQEVERTETVPAEVGEAIRRKAIENGFYAANMPAELGGGGLDTLTMTMMERELGRTSFALQAFVHRPSNILRACNDEQAERYLHPTIRGERMDCLAMTEPGAGSDLRGMKTTAVRDGGDWVINGTKHFISHADLADYTVLFAATGEEETPRGKRKKITTFLVDHDTPGLEVREGYRSVSHRGYHNCILNFDDCRVPARQVLGEEGAGFDLANTWLSASRLTVGTMCVGRARRAHEMSVEWSASRKQFGQPIGRFQGTGFKLADMATEIEAAEMLCLRAAWLHDQGRMSDQDAAMAKLFASEMLARVTDNAVQIYGGMGLMDELPIERFWRDARLERIWDGTSEIQRHIIARSLLRPHGA